MQFSVSTLLFALLATSCNACTSDLDCSLNGQCNRSSGACMCDKPWVGPACETMQFKPVSFPSGYGFPNITTWGGGVILGEDGKFHLFVSRMTNSCPLSTWTQNSRIDHAVADSVVGPYTFRDVAVNTWAHNAAPVTLADGTYAIFHIGTGEGGPDGGINCSSGTQTSSDSYMPSSSSGKGSTIHVSKSLDGPWLPLENNLGSCNNPAPWVHPNGTIYVGCGGSFKRAESVQGPYYEVAKFPMTGGPLGNYEDPQIYTDRSVCVHERERERERERALSFSLSHQLPPPLSSLPCSFRSLWDPISSSLSLTSLYLLLAPSVSRAAKPDGTALISGAATFIHSITSTGRIFRPPTA